MEIRNIKSDDDYRRALRRIDELMSAEADSAEADELDVWATLVDAYEEHNFPIGVPDAVDSIKFRMEQAGLEARELIPYIGSRGKVSEILSGKRPLTLQMIRALHEHLKIPADVLLRAPRKKLPLALEGVEWRRFPVNQMRRLGWLDQFAGKANEVAEEIMRSLMISAQVDALPVGLFRTGATTRQNSRTDRYALAAWCLQAQVRAAQHYLPSRYEMGAITKRWLVDLAKQSRFEDGPYRAKQMLGEVGIHLIVLPHLNKTYLDGAALRGADGAPIVAMSLRYDRLDNFWFCLFHELAHVHLHLPSQEVFIDDLSLPETAQEDPREAEADALAQESLIPKSIWESWGRRANPSILDVVALAQTLEISPAIVAGRIRKETNNYKRLTQLVGNGSVRIHFPEFGSRMTSRDQAMSAS